MSRIDRGGGSYKVDLKADGSGTTLNFESCSGAILIVESGAGTLELCCVDKFGGTPAPLVSNQAQPATFAVTAGKAYELPSAVFSANLVVVRGADVKGTLCVKA